VYKDVLEREDFVAFISDLFADDIGEELFEEVLERGFLGFVDHDFLHLLSDLLHLGLLGVASGLNLTVLSSGESNREKSDEVAIGGLGLDEGLDKGVPLFDEGAHLVSGDANSTEVGEAVESLNFFNLELDNSPCEVVLVLLVKISVSDLEDASSKRVSGDVYTRKMHCKRVLSNTYVAFQDKMTVNLLCPWALLQGVRVGTLTSKRAGALTLYHSFLWKAWTLQNRVINMEFY